MVVNLLLDANIVTIGMYYISDVDISFVGLMAQNDEKFGCGERSK